MDVFLKIFQNFQNSIFTLHLWEAASEFTYDNYGVNTRHKREDTFTTLKVSKYGVVFGPYFPVFGLIMEIYENMGIYESENNLTCS